MNISLVRRGGLVALAAATVLAALAAGSRAASTPQFTTRDLGTLGLDSYSVALNDHGQVTGYSYTVNAALAFSWTESEGMSDLGTLGGTYTVPMAINNSGQIVGQAHTPAGSSAFLWSKAGGIVNLGGSRAWDINLNGVTVGDGFGDGRGFIWRPGSGMMPVGDVGSSPRAINDMDQVIGFANSPSGSAGFSWTQASGMTYLNLPGGFGSSAQALNNLGVVVGSDSTDQGTEAFVWSSTTGMRDLGAGPCGYAQAVAVSDSGYVAGNARTSSCDVHAFVWTEQTGMLDLGTLGGSFSQAFDVNESGQVVGFSTTATGDTHAFSWTPSSGMTDLGTLGGSYSLARAVNDLGQVAGESQTASGGTHAVLWEPADTTPPELSILVTPNTLWPPNHSYITVEATVTATDDSGVDPTVVLDSATSNEPDNGKGDGNTVNDIVVVDQDTFQLRAERDEYGTGRIYTITYTATDVSGNSATQSATVTVPVTW